MDIPTDLISQNPDNDLEISDDSDLAYLTHVSNNTINPFGGHQQKKAKTLLKALITNACERDCNYCPFRAGRNIRRKTFTPNEIAKAYISIYNQNIADGIFLSSGIVNGGLKTQDQLIEAAEILRFKFQYQGYLHLKIIPGADLSQLERSAELADRISINLEAPNSNRLKILAPKKEFINELIEPIKWLTEKFNKETPQNGWNNRWPSLVTQLVVGPAGESDKEVLQASHDLYQKYFLRRVYYSRFVPRENTPFYHMPPTPTERVIRLYQASFLLRDYHFSPHEIYYNSSENLPLFEDPKLTWAKINLYNNPIEVNTASLNQLLRIPGIGKRSAMIIIQQRRKNKIKNVGELKQIGITSQRFTPFVLISGKRPEYQLSFLNNNSQDPTQEI